MRTQYAGRRGFNHQQFTDAIRAGHAGALLLQLEQSTGLALDSRINGGKWQGFLPRTVVDAYDAEGKPIGKEFGGLDSVAFDAQPELITVSNAGIPAFLSNFLDPKLIEVVVSPMRAAEIGGETKKGDWVTTVTTFVMIESTGEVAAYGDYNNGGNADANSNFPQRQSFHYQTFTQWGEKELAYAGLAGIDLASRKNIASVLVLNKFQNQSYFFGIAGLQNYGLLNDPALSAPIVPAIAGGWAASTAEQIFADIIRLFQQVLSQTGGTVDQDTRMTMALSPSNSVNLNKTNQFNVNVFDQIRKNFPGITVKTAPEYSTTSGELVQLIVDEYEGQETVTCAFTEKLRAHAMVVGSSSFSQKKSQGTWGAIYFRPAFVAQMLG
jgi:hypothetical protein